MGLCPLRLLLHRLCGFCGLLRWRCSELPHGHGLLHDYLVFTAILVAQVSHLVPELGYECIIVGVYPCVPPDVYPSSIPSIEVDVYPPVVFLFVFERPASDPLADGSLRHPEPAGSFLDCETIYPASSPFVHTGILDHLDRYR